MKPQLKCYGSKFPFLRLGWHAGAEIQELPLAVDAQAGWLPMRIHPAGAPMRVVTRIDGPRFDDFWLQTVTHLTPDTWHLIPGT